jgi:hypothetical protein
MSILQTITTRNSMNKNDLRAGNGEGHPPQHRSWLAERAKPESLANLEETATATAKAKTTAKADPPPSAKDDN